jgi:hypothetical protein
VAALKSSLAGRLAAVAAAIQAWYREGGLEALKARPVLGAHRD